MKTEIESSVSWHLPLEGDDRFLLTGSRNFVDVEYTILVHKVTDTMVDGLGRQRERGLRFTGERQLKNGNKSWQSKVVDLADGDPRIPAEIAEMAAAARADVQRLRELLKKES